MLYRLDVLPLKHLNVLKEDFLLALSTHIPKEITDYKERIVGDFSGRQLISLASIIGLLGGSYFLLVHLLHLSMDVYPYIAALLCAPAFALGFYRKNNMPFEQYLKLLWRFYFEKNEFCWIAEQDFDMSLIPESKESEDTSHASKTKKKKSDKNVQEVRLPKKKGSKTARKEVQRGIKAAKAEYRAAKLAAKKEAE